MGCGGKRESPLQLAGACLERANQIKLGLFLAIQLSPMYSTEECVRMVYFKLVWLVSSAIFLVRAPKQSLENEHALVYPISCQLSSPNSWSLGMLLKG